ncbi:MAG: histidine phosphatase family protein [Vulcanimicrobiaceae bacterium]|jgi:probable phosphoglycerate mutase
MSDPRTKVLLVRHGHVEGIDPPRFRGRNDLPLTSLGVSQAEAVAQRIAERWELAAVYSSPIGRAMHTAEAIAHKIDLVVRPDPDFIEIDYGQWTGLSHDDVRSSWPTEAKLWFRAPDVAHIPGGEALSDVFSRVSRGMRNLVRRHRNETIVVVGHEAINRVVLLYALELPLSHYWRFRQGPCCINDLDFETDKCIIGSINDASHV